jgi:hypothetical protein
MTPLSIMSLRQVAVRVLVHRAGPDADAASLAAAVRRSFDELAAVLAPLIGQIGIDALAGRAVHLAQREYPWLANTRDSKYTDGPLTHVIISLQQQDDALATDAAAAVLATFAQLLVTMIGEPLTARLMREAWPDGFPDAGTEETRA